MKLNNQKYNRPGDRIKRLRKERGLTQTEFARMIGRNFSTVSKLESGSLELSKTILETISRVFGVRGDWLINGAWPKEADKWALLEARAEELGKEVAAELARLKAKGTANFAPVEGKTIGSAQLRAAAEECAGKLMDNLGKRDARKTQAVAKVVDALMELLEAGAPPGAAPKKKKQ